MEEIIIDNEKALPRRRRWTSRALTLFFWGVFLYLLHPLFQVLLSFFSGGNSTRGMEKLPGFFLFYLLFLAGVGLLFQAWILYERRRSNREGEPLSLENPRGSLSTDGERGEEEERILNDLREGRILLLRHRPDGSLDRVRRLDPCA